MVLRGRFVKVIGAFCGGFFKRGNLGYGLVRVIFWMVRFLISERIFSFVNSGREISRGGGFVGDILGFLFCVVWVYVLVLSLGKRFLVFKSVCFLSFREYEV